MPAPLILGGTAPSASGVSRRTARRDLADEIGEFALVTTTATPSTATTPDAARLIVSEGLWADGQSPDRFDGFWAYVANGLQAGSVRKVLRATYDQGDGGLLVDRPFAAPLASGTEVELTDSLPAARHLAVKGLNEVLNEALERLLVWSRLSITGNGTRSYSLAAYPSIESPDQVEGIEDAYGLVSTDPPAFSPYGLEVRADGAAMTLVTDRTYTSAETLTLVTIRRGHTWIRSAGTWGTSTVGYASDDDEAAAPLHWLRAFGAGLAFRAMRAVALAERARVLKDRSLPRAERLALADVETERAAEYGRRIAEGAPARRRIVERELPRPRSTRRVSLTSARPPGWGGWP